MKTSMTDERFIEKRFAGLLRYVCHFFAKRCRDLDGVAYRSTQESEKDDVMNL
jgi:hypothetical protein